MPNLKLKCLDDSITYLLTSQVLPRFWSQWDIFPLNFRTVFFSTELMVLWIRDHLISLFKCGGSPLKRKSSIFMFEKKKKKKTEHKYVI